MNAALMVLTVAVLYCAACLDWLEESTTAAVSPLCQCGCGAPVHTPPRSEA